MNMFLVSVLLLSACAFSWAFNGAQIPIARGMTRLLSEKEKNLSLGDRKEKNLSLKEARKQLGITDNMFVREVAPEAETSNDHSELPDSFEDAVERSVLRTLDVLQSGSQRIRVDFDTSIGDVTYTSLKNTMPMLKIMVKVLSREMDLNDPEQALDEVEEKVLQVSLEEL